MAKGKTDEVGGQRSEVGGQPEPEPEAELVTVVAVERLFVAAEARYVEPGETVALPGPTAVVLVGVGAAVRVARSGPSGRLGTDRPQHEEAG